MQVQLEIFADGPTRIVRCSDTDTASALEGTVVSTMRRIHDTEHRLLITNQRFAALRGGNGISRLDLFGAAERRSGPLLLVFALQSPAMPVPCSWVRRSVCHAETAASRLLRLGSRKIAC